MKTRNFLIACLLVVCLLLPMAGCAEQESAIHPAGFDKYMPLLGWNRTSVLDQLELTAEDATKMTWQEYKLTAPVEYCGIPFEVWLENEGDVKILSSFFYTAAFLQGDEAAAEKILAVAKQLTRTLGDPSGAEGEADAVFVSEMTPATLAKALTGGGSVTDSWVLGTPDTQQTMAFCAWLEGYRAGKNSPENYPPTLLLQLRAFADKDGGFGLELRYTLDYYGSWEQPKK